MKLPIFINTPIRRYDASEWEYAMDIWQLTGPPSIKLHLCGDKCDVARSDGISMAKGLMPISKPPWPEFKIPEPPPEVTIQIDSDIMPRQPLKQAYDILKEDFAAGWDVVSAPTIHSESLTTMVWVPGGRIPGDRVSEVMMTAFGFVGFSPKFIEEVEPLYVDNSFIGSKSPHDMYCYFDRTEDDSTTFSKLVKDQGFKLGVDPRLLVTHQRGFQLDAWSAQLMKSWQKAVEQHLVGPYAKDNSFLDRIDAMVTNDGNSARDANAGAAKPEPSESRVRDKGDPGPDEGVRKRRAARWNPGVA